ncbi:hypothetical protein DN752_19670 [Echinicola strongylocentroti]|uniref:DUF4468 domain-containing protein n=1 Tax=Echinicola strongylocentroti TaxID=1795355 RepID=A0A2Z4IN71_9BACT|nr:DUF4468 domain-containing protein [Echinicola strongylocentroti]AWW32180.1 hypothetical protein DN752_19670 [Echinicola strongylocentroti]
MKNQILLLATSIILLSSCMSAKVVNMEDRPYVQVYESLDTSQDDLFLMANEWMIKTFNDAESVIQHSDKEDGVLMGKYLMSGGVSTGLYGTTSDSRVYSIIDIRVKDDKVRISITPQEWAYYEMSTAPKYTEEEAMKDMENLASSLYQHISTSNVDF